MPEILWPKKIPDNQNLFENSHKLGQFSGKSIHA
jgi:hypothetical protein